MDFNECEINMKIRAKKDISSSIKRGDEVRICFLGEDVIDISSDEVIVEGCSPKHFEKIDSEISMMNELVDDFIESNPDFKQITEEIQMAAKKKEKELLEEGYSKEEVRKEVVEEIARLTMLNFGEIIKSLGGE